MKRRLRTLSTAAALACLACACRQTISMPPSMRYVKGPEAPQMEVRREYFDPGPAPKLVKRETEGLVQRGGAFVKHGRERTFFASGSVESERHFVHGEPTGIWLAWWESGRPRSAAEFADDGSEREMSFWHANGELEARGMASRGRREGHWDFYFEDGAKESEGLYLGGLREGEWTSWNDCGEVVERAWFERGVKVAAPVHGAQ